MLFVREKIFPQPFVRPPCGRMEKNMSRIRIFSDSTCDLSPELIQEFDIATLPLYITLDDESYKDGAEITPDEIYAWSDAHKTTPKTAALAYADAVEAFQSVADAGDEAIFICISGEMSSTLQVLQNAAAEFPGTRIAIVDSRNLSTGVGLQVLSAAKMARAGKSVDEIVAALGDISPRVRASFVVDSITYLYRGGRCSAIAAFGATALNIKPSIVVEKGKMRPDVKFRGNIEKAILKYADNMHASLEEAETDMVFITHSGIKEETAQAVYRYLQEMNRFQNIYITRAGGVISSHCGPGTLGVLYIAKKD